MNNHELWQVSNEPSSWRSADINIKNFELMERVVIVMENDLAKHLVLLGYTDQIANFHYNIELFKLLAKSE